MRKSNKNPKKRINNRLKWVTILTIFWILLYLVISSLGAIGTLLNFDNSLVFGIILLIFGIPFVFFNEKMYELIILRYNVWMYKKMGSEGMEKVIKSDFYKKFYRTVTFIVGLIAAYMGASLVLAHFGVKWRLLF